MSEENNPSTEHCSKDETMVQIIVDKKEIFSTSVKVQTGKDIQIMVKDIGLDDSK